MKIFESKIRLASALIAVAIVLVLIAIGTLCALGFGKIVIFSIIGACFAVGGILLLYLMFSDDGDCYY